MKSLKDCLSNEAIESHHLDSDWRSMDDDNLRLLRIKVSSTWVAGMKQEIDKDDLLYWEEFLDQIRDEINKRSKK